MLDPRIYRTGLVAVAVAVIVFAFSLESLPSGPPATLAPDAFNDQNAYTAMTGLARHWPDRAPGSAGDAQVAGYVASAFGRLRLTVSRSSFSARTPAGDRTLQTVTGALAGSSSSSILVLSHRDAPRGPATADLSGTGVMIELARVLSGESPRHTIVFASTSGSLGAAGAAQLAGNLPGPTEAVIVLGDLAAAHPRQPLILPWSYGHVLSPAALANSLAGALGGQAGLRSTRAGVPGQILHLAFPMTVTEQAPLLARGVPAVEVTLSGERLPRRSEPISQASLRGAGRAVLQALNALDAGPQLPAPSGYLVYQGKLIPAWSMRLLALALILPVLMTAVDGLARARRRGHPVLRWTAWAGAWGVALFIAVPVILLARAAGLLSGAPAGPVPGGVAGPHGWGVVVLVLAGLALAAGLLLLRPWLSALAGARRLRREPAPPAAGIAVALLLCGATLLLWLSNPYGALLVTPVLHLGMWLGGTEGRIGRAPRTGLVLLAAVPVLGAVVYYAVTMGLSPLEVAWNGVLMIAGGQLPVVTVVVWSVIVGCVGALLALGLARAAPHREEPVPITVRGPLSYAGPGSLGGTESALRR